MSQGSAPSSRHTGSVPSSSPTAFEEGSWGTRGWFEGKLMDEGRGPASYFGHSANGYQRYRHSMIADTLKGTNLPYYAPLILDIGCALGDLGEKIGNLFDGSHVVGVDFVPTLLQQASDFRPDMSFAVVALPDLPFVDESCDLVVASEVLYYLGSRERECALAQIHRVLKPDGRLLFTSVLDDGSKYFSVSSAHDYIAGNMTIETVEFDHGLLFKWFSRNLRRVLWLRDSILGAVAFPYKQRKSMRRFMSWLDKVPALKHVLAAVLEAFGYVATAALSVEWLPRLTNRWSTFIPGDRSITNIIIVAFKGET